MPFRHADRSHDLDTRIAHEVRERLEEAIDFVCLDALVRARQARGLPAPAADSAADRAEYTRHVLALLRRLDSEVPPATKSRASGGDEQQRLLASQVTSARTLPDYWQRFEAVGARYLSEPGRGAPSGRDGRGLLARLFGRG